jgi:hypothetical protein
VAEKQWLADAGGRSLEQLIALEATHRIDSIVVAIEAVLMSKTEGTEAEHVVLAVEAMEREVNNGGFDQFFLNSSNEYARMIVPALRRIGAERTAEIADQAIRALGAEDDWPPEQYETAVADADASTITKLSECDKAYYESGEAIADMLFAFIKINRKDIDLG